MQAISRKRLPAQLKRLQEIRELFSLQNYNRKEEDMQTSVQQG